MVQPGRSFIRACGEREQAAVALDLVDDKRARREIRRGNKGIAYGRRIDGQNALQTERADSGRQSNTLEAWHGSVPQCSQAGEDRTLLCRGRENIAVGQQRHGILRILPE